MTNSETQFVNERNQTNKSPGGVHSASPGVLESLLESSAVSQNDLAQSHDVFGAAVGRVTGWCESGQPLVVAEGILDQALPATSVVASDQLWKGRLVVLLFERGDASRPIVLATLPDDRSMAPGSDDTENIQSQFSDTDNVQAFVDDERIVLKADREIVLQCGKASITLTRAGKIIIRGSYLLNRSSGVNRIKGGSVQIN